MHGVPARARHGPPRCGSLRSSLPLRLPQRADVRHTARSMAATAGPAPGPPRSLGQHLATRLTQLGVERFFGVPGDYNLQVRSGWTPWSVRGPSRRRSPPRTGAHRPARAANRAAACISAIRRAAAGICSNSLIAHLAAAGRALLPLCRSPLARFHTTPPCLRLAPNNPPALSC